MSNTGLAQSGRRLNTADGRKKDKEIDTHHSMLSHLEVSGPSRGDEDSLVKGVDERLATILRCELEIMTSKRASEARPSSTATI
jgi:hypothetical protein